MSGEPKTHTLTPGRRYLIREGSWTAHLEEVRVVARSKRGVYIEHESGNRSWHLLAYAGVGKWVIEEDLGPWNPHEARDEAAELRDRVAELERTNFELSEDSAIVANENAELRALLSHPLLNKLMGELEDHSTGRWWGMAEEWMDLRDAALAAPEGRGEGDDLTTAYMVGLEEGKDWARDEVAELRAALRTLVTDLEALMEESHLSLYDGDGALVDASWGKVLQGGKDEYLGNWRDVKRLAGGESES